MSELWKSDGTEAATIRVRTFSGPDPYPVSQDLVDAGGRLLLSAGDDTHGFELWDCDGTEVGTTMVKDINLGVGVPRSPRFSCTSPVRMFC